MQVELKQLTGIRRELNNKRVRIAHPVDEIFVDGQPVGQLAHHDDCSPCFYIHLEPEQRQEIYNALVPLRTDKWTMAPSKWMSYPPSAAKIREGVEVLIAEQDELEGDEEELDEEDEVEE